MLLALVCAFFVSTGAAVPEAACVCDAPFETNAWCEAHSVGQIGPLEIRSRVLFETLDAHGHVVDPSTFECSACQEAIRTSGFCETHRVGFSRGLAYFSRLTYELSRGTRLDTTGIDCAVCLENVTALRGWCPTHRRGIAGNVVISDPAAYARVERALEVVEAASAVAERCEHCAAAMVTDSQCPLCRITYDGGRPIAKPAPAQ